jgi:hypothetical protein
MKINSPQAEARRKDARKFAEGVILDVTPTVPRWQSSGDAEAIYKLIEQTEKSLKRELQYARIITKEAKPKKEKSCKACMQRKRIALAEKASGGKSKFRKANREECLKIIASIEECWPGFKKIPELLWNQYIDATGICRCGRPICPKKISKSAKTEHCSLEHLQKWQLKRYRQWKVQKKQEIRALAEAME